jgi:hypothetical protein
MVVSTHPRKVEDTSAPVTPRGDPDTAVIKRTPGVGGEKVDRGI